MALFLFLFCPAGNRLSRGILLCLSQGDCIPWEDCVKPPCVLAVLTASLFTVAVTSLLAAEPSLRVVASEATSFADLLREINCLDPDVILLEESMLLTTNTSLIDLMNTYSELRVIVVSENNNWLQVFRKKTQLITSAADLIEAIHTV